MFKNLDVYGKPSIKLEEALRIVKDAGYEGLEVDMKEIAPLVEEKSIDHVRNLFSDAKIVVGAWKLPWTTQGKHQVPHITRGERGISWCGDEEQYQKLLKVLPNFASISQGLGCTRVYTWVQPFSDEMNYDENFQWHLKRLRPVIHILRDFDCRLGLEWVAPKTIRIDGKYEFIHDMKGILELCEELGWNNVGLVADSWHLYLSGGTLNDIRKLRGNQIICVHVADAPIGILPEAQIDDVRAVPGETGVIDIVGFLISLKEIGYDGPVDPPLPLALGGSRMKNKTIQEIAPVNCTALRKLWRAAGL